jgi:hypothetical protein
MRKGDMEAMPKLVPDALFDQIAVVAPTNELGTVLRERYEGVLDRVSLYFPLPQGAPQDQWKGFVDQVHGGN